MAFALVKEPARQRRMAVERKTPAVGTNPRCIDVLICFVRGDYYSISRHCRARFIRSRTPRHQPQRRSLRTNKNQTLQTIRRHHDTKNKPKACMFLQKHPENKRQSKSFVLYFFVLHTHARLINKPKTIDELIFP